MWLPFATSLKQTIETMSVKGIYMEEDKKEEIKIVKVTEELIKAKTYEVRGYKVISIILFSDNVGNNKLHNIEFTDFCKEYPNVKISMQKTGEIFHDRFIVLDYGTADERVFLCGASSKDAGARITSIVEDYGTKKYASVMATLLQNPPLVLPK